MPVIKDPLALPARRTTLYPAPFNTGYEARAKRALTQALGLEHFGVNITTLEPGAKSAERHWYSSEDEFVYVLSGTLTLVTDAGEEILEPGMAAGFPAGQPDGHQLVNRGLTPATYLEIGTRCRDDDVSYLDLKIEKRDGVSTIRHKSGAPYT